MIENNEKLTLKEKLYIFKVRFKFVLNSIYSNDKEFKCYIIAMKMFIWISLIGLILLITYQIVGYNL